MESFSNQHQTSLTTHECHISFDAKRLSSDFLLADVGGSTKSTWMWFRKNEILSRDMLKTLVTNILKLCLTHRVDSYRIHLDRYQGAKLIKRVAHSTNYNDLSITQIVGLIWSAISVLHHFHIRIIPKRGYRAWIRRRQYNHAIRAYETVLLMLLPQLFSTVIQSLITFINEANIWELETFVALLIRKVLELCKDKETIVNHLLDLAVTNNDAESSRNILKVLYTILDYIQWKEMNDSLIVRMLDIFRQSIVNPDYETMKFCIEACLRHAFKHMRRKDVLKGVRIMINWTHGMESQAIVQFANLLEFAATAQCSGNCYTTSITDEVLPLVLEIVASTDVNVSLLGSRVLFFMLERNNNSMQLLSPRIYFQNVDLHIVIGKLDKMDKRFLHQYHSKLHSHLMRAVVNHCRSRVNLESIFANVAVIAVEVPCGYTAAASVCMAMALQEYAMTTPSLDNKSFYHIHACVMFVMTVVCYVHDAKVFYDYVNTVLSLRAQYAPQLNPPLRNNYNNPIRNLNKPELFFEDWEVRYGLWKCFITSNAAST